MTKDRIDQILQIIDRALSDSTLTPTKPIKEKTR